MTELWINRYKPKILDDYVTDQYQTILFYLDSFFKGKKGKGFILFGKPGTGKSALIDVIKNHYNADIFIINGSDQRNNLDFDSINAISFMGNKKIVVIEEVDGFNKQKFKEIVKIIELSKNPIILICNDIKIIDNSIKNKCYQKQIICDRFALKNLANQIIKKENLDISKDDLNKALISITSYRELYNFLQFNIISETGSFSEAENLKDTLQFISDNVEEPKLISLADIFLKQSQLGYKNGQKISKYILNSIDVKKSEYPRTYRLISEVKKAKKNPEIIKITGFK